MGLKGNGWVVGGGVRARLGRWVYGGLWCCALGTSKGLEFLVRVVACVCAFMCEFVLITTAVGCVCIFKLAVVGSGLCVRVTGNALSATAMSTATAIATGTIQQQQTQVRRIDHDYTG